VAGLEKLEYRGYDSAGISLLAGAGAGIDSVRAIGPLAALRAALAQADAREHHQGPGDPRTRTARSQGSPRRSQTGSS